MAYNVGSVSDDNGLQQVSLHPQQELTSLNANKTLRGLWEPGVYNTEAEVSGDATNVIFTIKKGTTFIFNKLDESINIVGTPTELLGKIYLQDDATVTVTIDSLLVPSYDVSALVLYSTWDYNVANSTSIFANFAIGPYSPAFISEVEGNNDVILAIILNHQAFRISSNFSAYQVAYQNQTYRDTFKHMFETTSSFPISFGHTGQEISVGPGQGIIGSTYVTNKNGLMCDCLVGSNWPTKVAPPDGSSYLQIDVLRMVTENVSTDGPDVTHLTWQSFLTPTVAYTSIPDLMDGIEFEWVEQGFNLLFAVRPNATLSGVTPIWPSQCYIVNPLLPQIGLPKLLSRFKLPVY